MLVRAAFEMGDPDGAVMGVESSKEAEAEKPGFIKNLFAVAFIKGKVVLTGVLFKLFTAKVIHRIHQPKSALPPRLLFPSTQELILPNGLSAGGAVVLRVVLLGLAHSWSRTTPRLGSSPTAGRCSPPPCGTR